MKNDVFVVKEVEDHLSWVLSRFDRVYMRECDRKKGIVAAYTAACIATRG